MNFYRSVREKVEGIRARWREHEAGQERKDVGLLVHPHTLDNRKQHAIRHYQSEIFDSRNEFPPREHTTFTKPTVNLPIERYVSGILCNAGVPALLPSHSPRSDHEICFDEYPPIPETPKSSQDSSRMDSVNRSVSKDDEKPRESRGRSLSRCSSENQCSDEECSSCNNPLGFVQGTGIDGHPARGCELGIVSGSISIKRLSSQIDEIEVEETADISEVPEDEVPLAILKKRLSPKVEEVTDISDEAEDMPLLRRLNTQSSETLGPALGRQLQAIHDGIQQVREEIKSKKARRSRYASPASESLSRRRKPSMSKIYEEDMDLYANSTGTTSYPSTEPEDVIQSTSRASSDRRYRPSSDVSSIRSSRYHSPATTTLQNIRATRSTPYLRQCRAMSSISSFQTSIRSSTEPVLPLTASMMNMQSFHSGYHPEGGYYNTPPPPPSFPLLSTATISTNPLNRPAWTATSAQYPFLSTSAAQISVNKRTGEPCGIHYAPPPPPKQPKPKSTSSARSIGITHTRSLETLKSTRSGRSYVSASTAPPVPEIPLQYQARRDTTTADQRINHRERRGVDPTGSAYFASPGGLQYAHMRR